MKKLSDIIRPFIRRFGIDIVGFNDRVNSAKHIEIRDKIMPFTVTSTERVNGLLDAVKYIIANGIEGSFVECGVFKGGSTMAMAYMLNELNIKDRDIYLYDTYSGMTEPRELDVSMHGEVASEKFKNKAIKQDNTFWCYSGIDEVKKNVFSTGYPEDNFKFIKGKVEDTIPENTPDKIALLRLDTDWYESTKHELIHLFPKIVKNGVLIIDDYGHWEGARKAVDEYIEENNIMILLNKLDYSGRIGIKS